VTVSLEAEIVIYPPLASASGLIQLQACVLEFLAARLVGMSLAAVELFQSVVAEALASQWQVPIRKSALRKQLPLTPQQLQPHAPSSIFLHPPMQQA
jgi:hypothetical protein